MDVCWAGAQSLNDMVNEGVRRAHLSHENKLRASIIANTIEERCDTGDNASAIIYTELVLGNKVEINIAAKGGGIENKATFSVLNPNDNLVDWILNVVRKMGAGWCPPGIMSMVQQKNNVNG